MNKFMVLMDYEKANILPYAEDYIVDDAPIADGALTIAHQPDFPRSLTFDFISTTATADLTVVGTNKDGVSKSQTTSIISYLARNLTATTGWATGTYWRKMSFTPTTTGYLYGFQLYLSKLITTPGNHIVDVYLCDASHSPTGSALATVTRNGSAFSLTGQVETFWLASYVWMTAGLEYAIVERPNGNIQRAYEGSSVYAGGQAGYSSDGITWTEQPTIDYYFVAIKYPYYNLYYAPSDSWFKTITSITLSNVVGADPADVIRVGIWLDVFITKGMSSVQSLMISGSSAYYYDGAEIYSDLGAVFDFVYLKANNKPYKFNALVGRRGVAGKTGLCLRASFTYPIILIYYK